MVPANGSMARSEPCIAGTGEPSVGYDSPTQFNREYRRLFGAPPGQDAARLRVGS